MAIGILRAVESRIRWTPLDADFRERVLHTVLAPETESAAETPGKVLPFRRRAVGVGGWLAVAATLAFLVARLGDSGDPLPEYLLELEGGVRQIRSEDAGAAERVFAPGSRLELVLRPRTAVAGPVEASFFVARGEELRFWDVAAEISPTGAVRIAGILGRDFELEPGDWTVWAAVGRSGTLPGRDRLQELLADLEPPVAGDWILLRTEVRVVAD